ncbi:MAG: FtsW/RodA/SpoVE family cell cycle protein [Nitrospira sp.]|nr:FtsW/RodA/SpoVE family cell cycle protein [Nitrospira sp.]
MIDRLTEHRGLDGFDMRYGSLILAILAIGVLSIYSVTQGQHNGLTPYYLKQLMWIGLGAVAFLVMWASDYHQLARFAYPAYAFILLMLIFVLFEGRTSKGAQRWLALGPFSFQPSEFAKLILILVLAHYYSKAPRVGWLQRVIVPGFLVLPGLLLILKQPDLGSGLSFVAIYAAMLLMVGIRSQAIGFILLFGIMLFPFAWEGSGGPCMIISDSALWRSSTLAMTQAEKAIMPCNQGSLSVPVSSWVKGSMAGRRASSSFCRKGIPISCLPFLRKNGDFWVS